MSELFSSGTQTNKQTIEQVSFMSNQQPFATKHPMVKLFEESNYFFLNNVAMLVVITNTDVLSMAGSLRAE